MGHGVYMTHNCDLFKVKVMGSYECCKSGNTSDTVQDIDIVITYR